MNKLSEILEKFEQASISRRNIIYKAWLFWRNNVFRHWFIKIFKFDKNYKFWYAPFNHKIKIGSTKMWLLNKLETLKKSDKSAAICKNQNLNYKFLLEYSDNLAKYVIENYKNNLPIIVYGHKNPFMLVCFLACIKSYHAYCPIEISSPL